MALLRLDLSERRLRKAAERTVEGLYKAKARILEIFQLQERRNYFVAVG